MPKEARHHHYIPQCYLRGFLPKGERATLAVLDLKERRSFLEHPQGVCSVRDFNRLEIDGIPPDGLENAWSSSETDWADALKNLHQNRTLDDETTYRAVMTLIALFAVRNPCVRAQWSQAMNQLGKLILATTLATKERYEATLRDMRKRGTAISCDVPYKEVRKSVLSGETRIEVPTEAHIVNELRGIDCIYPLLCKRRWSLVIASDVAGTFVTCDKPVNLCWKHPEQLPLSRRDNPGFGCRETMVVFPISQTLAVIGDFESEDQVLTVGAKDVAAMNSLIIGGAMRQVYAPNLSFGLIDGKGNLIRGSDLLRS